MWYFLSQGEFSETLTDVRSPEMAYQESTTKRLCVAPTVTQCVLALAALEGDFFVYTIDVSDPIPADTTVRDRDTTAEHWITAEILEDHGGSIPVHRQGSLRITKDLRDALKFPFFKRTLAPGWEQNESRLWNIKDGVWSPKFGGPSEVESLLQSRP